MTPVAARLTRASTRLAVFALITLLLAEVAARAVESRTVTVTETLNAGPVFVPDPVLGWRPVPGALFEIPTSRGVVHESYDSRGLLGPDTTSGTARLTLLAVGDSMTAARQVPHSERFVSRVEEELTNALGVPVAFLNAGRDGYQTDQELLYYEREGRQLAPDVVILFFFPANDVMSLTLEAVPTGGGFAPKPRFSLDNGRLSLQVPVVTAGASAPGGPFVPAAQTEASFRTFAYRASALYRLYVRARSRCELPFVSEIYRDPPTEATRRAWDLAAAIIRRFDATVRSDGARFGVVMLPERTQLLPSVAWRLSFAACGRAPSEWSQDAPTQWFDSICTELRASCLDLTPGLRGSNSEFFLADGHFSPHGHAIVGARVREWLVRSGLVR